MTPGRSHNFKSPTVDSSRVKFCSVVCLIDQHQIEHNVVVMHSDNCFSIHWVTEASQLSNSIQSGRELLCGALGTQPRRIIFPNLFIRHCTRLGQQSDAQQFVCLSDRHRVCWQILAPRRVISYDELVVERLLALCEPNICQLIAWLRKDTNAKCDALQRVVVDAVWRDGTVA